MKPYLNVQLKTEESDVVVYLNGLDCFRLRCDSPSEAQAHAAILQARYCPAGCKESLWPDKACMLVQWASGWGQEEDSDPFIETLPSFAWIREDDPTSHIVTKPLGKSKMSQS